MSQFKSFSLPTPQSRMDEACKDSTSGGAMVGGSIRDTHFLGSAQWDYCRMMAKLGKVYDQEVESFIATNKVRMTIACSSGQRSSCLTIFCRPSTTIRKFIEMQSFLGDLITTATINIIAKETIGKSICIHRIPADIPCNHLKQTERLILELPQGHGTWNNGMRQ